MEPHGIEHDLVFPDFSAGTDRVNRKGASSVTVFRADKAGEHPYFAVTKKDGTFTIPDVPPGNYTLVAWQESSEDVQVPVTVKAKEAVQQTMIAFCGDAEAQSMIARLLADRSASTRQQLFLLDTIGELASVYSLAAYQTNIFLGGSFSTVGASNRVLIAAVDASLR